jgi:pathogenesis-related protein 1
MLRFIALLVVSLCACTPAAVPGTSQSTTPTDRPTVGAAKPSTATRDRAETGKLVGLTAAHNQVRAKVGVAPLRWSNALARWAGAWASRLAARGCRLDHRPARDDSYGENIFWSSGAVTSGDVVAQWAAEQADFDHARNACKGMCGHFTQIVWKRTTQLGCAVASCAEGGEIWVCNYDPAGNVMGQSPY